MRDAVQRTGARHRKIENSLLQRLLSALSVPFAQMTPRLPTVQVAGRYGPRASAEEVDERSDAEGDGCQQGEQEFESGADADRLE